MASGAAADADLSPVSQPVFPSTLYPYSTPDKGHPSTAACHTLPVLCVAGSRLISTGFLSSLSVKISVMAVACSENSAKLTPDF